MVEIQKGDTILYRPLRAEAFELYDAIVTRVVHNGTIGTFLDIDVKIPNSKEVFPMHSVRFGDPLDPASRAIPKVA